MISIITPTFNSRAYIRETLDCLLAQSYHNWECIFIDDGSVDDTIEILMPYIEKDSRFSLYIRPDYKKKGPSSARNYGLEKAKGEFVVFLDSDDLLSRDCLLNRIKFKDKFPNFDFWIFKANVFGSESMSESTVFNTFPLKTEFESSYYTSEFLRGKFPFIIMCPLWRKEILLRLNGFDENMRMLEDPDLHLRAFKLGLVSKTAVKFDSDCFYRVEERIEREERIKRYSLIAAKSNFYFLEKHQLINNDDFKVNFKRIYNLYVFSQNSFRNNFTMINIGTNNNLLSTKRIVLSYMILIFGYLKLKNIKFPGYYRLRTKFNNF